MTISTTGFVQAPAVRVSKVSTNGQDGPLAVAALPTFSWQLAGSGKLAHQEAFQVIVADTDGTPFWDSGERVDTTQHLHYDGPALDSDSDYSWKLRVRHASGAFSPWSEPAAFGVGLADSDWTADWISRTPGGRASVGVLDGSLRIASADTLQLPFADAVDFTLRARYYNTMGRVALLLRGSKDPSGAWTHGVRIPVAPGASGWHDLLVRAAGETIEVAVDGLPALSFHTDIVEAGFLAIQQGPKEQLELASLSLETANGTHHLSFPESGLDGWQLTTKQRQLDEWTWVRGTFPLAGAVSRARLYVAGCHQYELYVNGQLAGRGGSFSYPGEGRYQTFDVTEQLRGAHEATVAALLHWFGPGQGRAPVEPGLLAQLSITYDDGVRASFGTGPEWVVTEGPYEPSGYRNDEGDPVEHLNALLFPGGNATAWQQPGFDDSSWQPALASANHPLNGARLLPQETAIAENHVLCKELLQAADGTLVADFGQVLPARPVVKFVRGIPGRTVTLRAGYTLSPDGRVNSGKLQTQNTDLSFPYTQSEGAQEYRAFTHLGFRYLEIPGVAADELEAVGAVVVHGAHPFEGTLESSDPDLNAVVKLLADSTLFGIQEQFVDTPTREKGQFLGDAVNISYAAMSLFGDRGYTRMALLEFADSAKRYWSGEDERGRYNAVYPNGDGKRDIPDFSLQMVEWALEYFRHSGDLLLLAELYPQLRDTAEYVLRHLPHHGPTAGLVTDLGGGSGPYLHGIVDWPAPGRFGYDMDTSVRTTVNAQAYGVLEGVATLANLLERPVAEGARYVAAAASLTEVMNTKLRIGGRFVDGLRADGSPSTHASSHATSFPLSLGVTDPVHWVSDAEYLASRGMMQGPMTVHRLFRALLKVGNIQAVVDLLTNADGPGWMRILAAGGTFAWEAWELVEGTDYSQSHAWSASVLAEIIEFLLGVQILEPGAGRLRLAPPMCSLTGFTGTVPTERGPVSLAWQREGTLVSVQTTLPAGTRAVLEVPAGRYKVSGAHAHSYDSGPSIELSPGRWEVLPA